MNPYIAALFRHSQRTVEGEGISYNKRNFTDVEAGVGLKEAPADRWGGVELRKPDAEDGPGVTALVAGSPPLDTNSAYCNLLQCTDFRDTCVVAERGDELLGWISAYRPPSALHRLFIWQVAISPDARGTGLAIRMLQELLDRPSAAGTTEIVTTITDGNDASWGLFRSLARRLGAELTRSRRFDRETHFAGCHDTEWEARIAALPGNGEKQWRSHP